MCRSLASTTSRALDPSRTDRSRLRIGFGYRGQAVRTSAIVAVLITAALGCVEAQLVNYRDPAIPRSRDGRPNLSAPMPRLSGRPDLSGLWQAERTPMSEFARVLGPEGTKIQPDLNDITLVVETTGFKDRAWLDVLGHPRSEAMHMTERYRRRDFGHMDLEITIDDPTYYTRPFGFKTTLTMIPDSDVLEYVCTENQKDTSRQ